uniref:Uncharacterized protein n=1 Tax=Anguilla anguilla TaxID=7936 RepID=A0A0E9XXZ1_ANGAN
MYRVTSQKIIINCLSHRGVVSIEKHTCIYKRYLSKQNPHTKAHKHISSHLFLISP